MSFQNHIHHLLAELQRVDLLIRQFVDRMRQDWESNQYSGLVISEEEISALLEHPLLAADQLSSSGASQIGSHLAGMRADLDKRIAATLHAGTPLRLPRLMRLFELGPLEVDALLICLAVELDLRYERLYAYAQDDVTKKRPRVDLILNILCHSLADRLAARTLFLPTNPLLRHNILDLSPEPGQPHTPLLGQFANIQQRILDFLLGIDGLDARLLPFARLVAPTPRVSELSLPSVQASKLDNLIRSWRADGSASIKPEGTTLYLTGTYGSGRTEITKLIGHSLGSKLLVVDVDRLLAGQDGGVGLVFREARLQDAVILLQRFEGDDRHQVLLTDEILNEIKQHPGPVCLASERSWEPRGKLGDRLFMRLELPLPDYDTRSSLWVDELARYPTGDASLPAEDVTPLASKFAFSPGQIHDAVVAARGLAAWRSPGAPPTLDELYAAARAQSTPILTTMARKITPRYDWDDIVLEEDSLETLHEIANTIKNRHIVYGQWHFDRKMSTGLGLNVLFSGESGTGKTMAADILAGELGLDLYKIDLSGIISKYIGETEKNLDRIFGEARTSNAILFFDEADAVFGKRSEVRDSHDRYANIEVSYLLQKMEDYDGVVILASNLSTNMDEAFVRRMHFLVDFPMPEWDRRLRIWQVHFPGEAPRGPDLDLEFLARQFEIAGGNIRNVVLAAAFLAAEDQQAIHMRHLIRATRRELQKMGRLVRESDFGEYYPLVDGGKGNAP